MSKLVKVLAIVVIVAGAAQVLLGGADVLPRAT